MTSPASLRALYKLFERSPELSRVERVGLGMRVSLHAPLDFEGFLLPAGTELQWGGELHPSEFRGTTLSGTRAQLKKIRAFTSFTLDLSGRYWRLVVDDAFEVGEVRVPVGSCVEWVFYGWEDDPLAPALVHEVVFPNGQAYLGKYLRVKFNREERVAALQAAEDLTLEGMQVPKGFWITFPVDATRPPQVDASGPSDPMMRHYDGSSAAD